MAEECNHIKGGDERMAEIIAHVYDNQYDEYPEFRTAVNQYFTSTVGSGIPLFTTDAEGLFDIFLANLPDEARQHYTCNACRGFVTRYGGLVSISEDGKTASVMWDEHNTPSFFRKSVAAMQKVVLKAKVTGIFVSDKEVLGQPVTGEWEHFFAMVPQKMVHRDRLKTAGQVEAEKLEEYRMLCTSLQDYPTNVVEQAVSLIDSEALYRGDKVKGVADWFKALRERLNGTKDSRKQANIRWLTVATAPAGFAHLRGGMLGTLLDDIKEGKSVSEIVRNFKEKMDPLQYQRPQAAPTEGNIQQAEKIVEKLGIANSLRRRYARFEEIPAFIWQPPVQKAETKTTGGVFDHLTPKGAAPSKTDTMTITSTTMTWEKFLRTVLPTAEAIEALVDNPGKCMALVTAADPDAPNILQWDNTFSWYFKRQSTYRDWNVPANGYVKVKGIINSPNHWDADKPARSGHQIFFLLEGCRDVSGATGGGLFPELLKAELHEIRATLEAHSNKTAIEDADNASACGMGFSKDNAWNLTIKVTENRTTRLIKIDRWD